MNVDSTQTYSQTILSIGPGQLGIERGIEKVVGKLRVAAYVEVEAFIIQNLIFGMEKGLVAPAPIWADLKTFRPEPFRDRIHGITAGYPCQPFSNAGLRKGNKDPRHLWPYIEQTIHSARPFWCFFENVEGHLTLGFSEVYKSLKRMGYSVEKGIFSAEEVGAPHQRKRLFILGVADSYCSRFRGIYKKGLQSETQRSDSKELGNIASTFQCRYRYKSEHEKIEIRRSGNNDLANTCSQRLPGWQEQHQTQFQTTERGSAIPYTSCLNGFKIRDEQEPKGFGDNGSKWPAKPGPYQHNWEAPRTIEPGMGCAINGYNFREDLLRMYGNGVVEQTAELAWRVLWKKQEENFKRAIAH